MVRRLLALVVSLAVTSSLPARADSVRAEPVSHTVTAAAGVFIERVDGPGGAIELGYDHTSGHRPDSTTWREFYVGARLAARNTNSLSLGTLSVVGGFAARFDGVFLGTRLGLGLVAEEDRRGTGFVLGVEPSVALDFGLMLDDQSCFFIGARFGALFARYEDGRPQSYLEPVLGYRGEW